MSLPKFEIPFLEDKMEKVCKNWAQWLKQTRFDYMDETQKTQTINWLIQLRNELINLAEIYPGQKVIDLGCGSGLLGFGVIEQFEDNVEVIFSDKYKGCLDECQQLLENLNVKNCASFLKCNITNIRKKTSTIDRALTRSVLVHVINKPLAFGEIYRILKPDGIYVGFEPIISQNTRYYELLKPNQITNYCEFKEAEKDMMEDPEDALVNFNHETLTDDLQESGFIDVKVRIETVTSNYIVSKEGIEKWFLTPPGPNQKTMKQRFLEYFDEEEVDVYIKEVQKALNNKNVTINSKTAFIKAIK